jgi:NAD(P)-dependent dehydrogenase (short-subunit alcohol dehydrogenase family)
MSVTYDLSGRCALVTGASRGNGLLCAQKLATAGADVYMQALDSDGAMEAAAAKVRAVAPQRRVAWGVFDFTDIEAPERMVEAALAALGRIDILINNAGVGGNTPFLETSLEEWNKIISINLTGAFLVAQACAREMVKTGGGKIVNIASLSGQRGGNGRAAYGSAKAGLELLTKVMAVELSPHNINVNNIAPGAIETEMAKYAHDQATRAAYNYLIPMTRYGTPEEIADAAVFLCSDESRYVQGHTLNVDGGFRAAGLMFGSNKAVPSR